MCELRICRDIIDVPDLHICHVPLHVAQRFHVRKPKKYDVAGFEICWLAVVENNFTKSLYRIEVAENLRHFQLHIPQAVWDRIGEHVRLLGFTPTYRLATLAN